MLNRHGQERAGYKTGVCQFELSTVNTGVPLEQTACTCAWLAPSESPCWKVTSTFAGSDPSTSTRQPLSGWAIRSVMKAPVQRTETCPPVTWTVLSIGVVELTGLAPLLDGGGDVDPWGLVDLLGMAVAPVVAGAVVALDAEGAGVAPVPVGTPFGVAFTTVEPSEGIASEVAPGSLISRPARSMANHAVADTPATVTTQIIAMPTAGRSFTTTDSPPCRHCVTFASPRHAAG